MSKALRATIFSADVHFQSLIGAVTRICALTMLRFTLGVILAPAGCLRKTTHQAVAAMINTGTRGFD